MGIVFRCLAHARLVGFFICLLMSLPLIGWAQTYPVQARVELKAPYSLTLSDYAASGADNLTVHMRLLQTNRPSYRVGLRVTIEGVGITITSSPHPAVPHIPIELRGGESISVQGADLRTYLHPDNLIFKGYSKEAYKKTNTLPEGVYQITIEVLDFAHYSSGLLVSNRASGTAWLEAFDPPFFNRPQQNMVVSATLPQNVVFSWTPRHRGSLQTTYTFFLVEVNPGVINEKEKDIDLQQATRALLTNDSFFETELTGTMLLYDHTRPLLIPGKLYAARVQAKERNNLSVFRNNGFSEVTWFRFGEPCLPVGQVQGNASTFRRADIAWVGQENHTRFDVQYRAVGQDVWYEQESMTNAAAINDLRPGNSYEFQVRAYCGNTPSSPSESFVLSTPTDESPSSHESMQAVLDQVQSGMTEQEQAELETVMNEAQQEMDAVRDSCESNKPVKSVDKTSLLASAQAGSFFIIGSFPMVLKEVTGAQGAFSGKGDVFVPFLGVMVKATFDNIKVNSKRQVFEGEVLVESTGISLLDNAELQKLIAAEEKENQAARSGLCQPEEPASESDAATPDTEASVFLLDDMTITGTLQTVNGIPYEADQELLPGDVVTVQGPDGETTTIVIDKVDRKRKRYSAHIPAAGSDEAALGSLAKDLEDLLLKTLKTLEKEGKVSLNEKHRAFKGTQSAIDGILQEHRIPESMIKGSKSQYFNEGFSNEIVLPNKQPEISDNPIMDNLLKKHHDLYLLDKDVLYLRDALKLMDSYQKKEKLLVMRTKITTLFKQLNTQTAETYQSGRAAEEYQQWLKTSIEKIIQEDVQTLRSPGTSFMWSPDLSSALAHAGDVQDVADYWGLPATGEQDVSPYVYAQALHKIIEQGQRQLFNFSATDATNLPIGISKSVGNEDWVLAIDKMKFTPAGAYLDAYTIVPLPFAAGKVLAFSAHDIQFRVGGMPKVTKLALVQDISLSMTSNVMLTFKAGADNTYFSNKCGDFEVAIAGEFEFCENFLRPDVINDKPTSPSTGDQSATETPKRVKARFKAVVNTVNGFNLIAQADIDPFQVPALPGWGFTAKDLALDLSDLANPTNLHFPSGYTSPDGGSENGNLWRGFYAREVSVRIPSYLNQSKSTANQRREIGLRDLVIGKMENRWDVSLSFFASHVFSLTEGEIGGWRASVDSINITVLHNEFQSGHISGAVDLPMLESVGQSGRDAGDFAYALVMLPPNDASDINFTGSASVQSGLKIPMWGVATLELAPSSRADIGWVNHALTFDISLTGNLSISTALGKDEQKPGKSAGDTRFTAANISFENLKFMPRAPYVSASAFSLGTSGGNKAGGFPISIKDVGFRKSKNNPDITGLGFTVMVNLVTQDNGGWGGECAMTVFPKAVSDANLPQPLKFVFDHVEVSRIAIKVDAGALKIDGAIEHFYDDEVYGSGWYGQVSAYFVPGIVMKAAGVFGEHQGVRYWSVEGRYANYNAPLPVPGLPFLAVYGAQGGAYQFMRVAGPSDKTGGKFGLTPNGRIYVPDKSVLLGLKLGVILGALRPEAFNGDLMLEVSFGKRTGGIGLGVNAITLQGSAFLLTPLKDGIPDQARAQVWMKADIRYDLRNNALHAYGEVYVNAANLLKGKKSNNLAGTVSMHFDQSNWEILAGTPDDANAIVASIADKLKVDLESYLMVGSNVPDMPPPPKVVSEILQANFDDVRDPRSMARGSGFVFGARLNFDTGEQGTKECYFRFRAGAGFDVMLKNYGADAFCAGDSKPVGVNGWYAAGQIYAYLQGHAGVHIKFLFVDIHPKINISMGAILQAKFPNPWWIRGRVVIPLQPLIGLPITIRKTIEYGKTCVIQTSSSILAEEKIIEDLTPTSSETEASVFTSPQAIFSRPINHPFTLTDTDDSERTFMITLEEFKVYDGTTEVPGELQWNDDLTVAVFNSLDILPPNKSLRASVKISFKENVRGGWRPIKQDDKVLIESRETTFTTGSAPDYIPESNIAYSYPVLKQKHFFKKETNTGYIKLKKGQPYLFDPGAEWIQQVRFVTAAGDSLDIDFTYNAQQIRFLIPANLANDAIYAWRIMNIPAYENAPIDQNITASTQTVVQGDVTVTRAVKKAQGSVENKKEQAIFSSYFKTSRYNTFADKLRSLSVSAPWMIPIRAGVQEIGVNYKGDELFDKADLQGTQGNQPLIQWEADVAHTRWYTELLYPLFYRDYAYQGFTIRWRTESPLGIPPVRAVTVQQQDVGELSENEWKRGRVVPINASVASPTYRLSYYVMEDHNDLLQQAAKYILTHDNPWAANLVLSPRPYMLFPETYPVIIRYVLPGTDIITHQETLLINRN